MASSSILSRGCLRTIVENPEYASWFWQTPRVQCVHIKAPAAGDDDARRQYVVLSDGINFFWTMLSSTLCTRLRSTSEDVAKGCICRIEQCTAMTIRNRIVLVVTSMHVASEFGTLPKIGRPGRLDVVLPLLEEQIWFKSGHVSISADGHAVSRLPPELLHMVLEHLDQADRLALAMTSKTFHALVGQFCPTQVHLTGGKSITKFKEAVGLNPAIRNVVRGYSAKITGPDHLFDVPIVQELPLLRDCRMQFEHTSADCCVAMLAVMERLLSGQTSPCLKSFELVLNSNNEVSWIDDVQSHILQTIFLAPGPGPSIKHLTACYRAHEESQTYSDAPIYVSSLSFSPWRSIRPIETTDLRSLDLRWDGMELVTLRNLLEPHRAMHTLTLTFTPHFNHARYSRPTLDAALKPVAETLRTLHVCVAEPTLVHHAGIHWGSGGLSAFNALRHLRLPALSVDDVLSGNDTTKASSKECTNIPAPWLPPSLVSMCFNTATLDDADKVTDTRRDNQDVPNANSASAKAKSSSRHPQFVAPDAITTSALGYIGASLRTGLLPSFRTLVFNPDSHQHTLNPLILRTSPPILSLETGMRPLIDRGVRVVVEFETFNDVSLEVQVRETLGESS